MNEGQTLITKVVKSQMVWVKVGQCPTNKPFYLEQLKHLNKLTIHGINFPDGLGTGTFDLSVTYDGTTYDSLSGAASGANSNFFSISLARENGDIFISEMPLNDLFQIGKGHFYKELADVKINWEKSYIIKYAATVLTNDSALPLEIFHY